MREARGTASAPRDRDRKSRRGIFIAKKGASRPPFSFHKAKWRTSFQAACPRLRDDVILRPRSAGYADRADDLAADDDRVAAARADHVVERREIVEEIALAH